MSRAARGAAILNRAGRGVHHGCVETDALGALLRQYLDCGREGAMDELVSRTRPRLLAVARRIGAPQDAEDAAQEALVKVFAQASRFDPERDALAWAVEIAAWEVRTVLRRRGRRREEAGHEERLAAHRDPGPTPEEVAVAQDLNALLDGLPALDREALSAWATDERPAGLPPATFRKRVERALRRARRRLGLEPASDGAPR